ncbi:hypothetical protein [Streptomyces eurythermus]|uniref:hypothetical protein n=1 Tax=Streptomyces eurythermus TaxID=42237 RepID=UPI0036D39BC3
MRIDHFLLVDGDEPLWGSSIHSERMIEEFLGLPGPESLSPATGDHAERVARAARSTGPAEHG